MPFGPKLENLLYRKITDPESEYKAEYIGPYPPSTADMPTGNSDDMEETRNWTVGFTLFGMFFLLHEIKRKTGEPVNIFS